MADPPEPAVSVVVVAHAEGRLLHPCIVACDRAVQIAAGRGLACERILVLSAPDTATVNWVRDIVPEGWQIRSSPEDDLATARNLGVAVSQGGGIAIMDGGDLPCADWLVRAHAEDKQGACAAWHPEAAVHFGPTAACRIRFHPDAVTSGYDYAALVDANPFAGGVFARRSVFEAVPYPAPDPARGFALTDWQWHCAVVAAGIHHRVVVDTWHYVRQHPGGYGLGPRALSERRRPGPTPMFEAPGRRLVDAPRAERAHA